MPSLRPCPRLAPLAIPLGLLVIAVLLGGNLRGVRAAGNTFATPCNRCVVEVGRFPFLSLPFLGLGSGDGVNARSGAGGRCR
jgi:hypothetical protein